MFGYMNHYLFDEEINKNKKIKDFTMPQMSNQSRPINNKHDNYIFDRNAQMFYNQNQGNYHNPVNTRMVNDNLPVQNNL